jgi:hypothetical protein
VALFSRAVEVCYPQWWNSAPKTGFILRDALTIPDHIGLCPCLSYCFYGSALLTVTYCRLFVFIFHLFRVSCGVDSDRTVMKDWLANLLFMQCFVRK